MASTCNSSTGPVQLQAFLEWKLWTRIAFSSPPLPCGDIRDLGTRWERRWMCAYCVNNQPTLAPFSSITNLFQYVTNLCKFSLVEPYMYTNIPHSSSFFQLMPTFSPDYIIICNTGKGYI